MSINPVALILYSILIAAAFLVTPWFLLVAFLFLVFVEFAG